jgi:uncharacterized membrane protein
MIHVISRIPFAVMTGLSVLLFCMTFMYFNFRPDVNFLLTKQDIVFDPIWRTAFYIHITGGMLALITGPINFIKKIRQYNLGLHRLIGKIYITSILLIAAPTGCYMAFYANGGIYSTLGFLLMSILWFYTTFMAITTIRKKKVEEHIKWMVRSYAMTFAAVTLRLLVPIMSMGFNMEHITIIVATAWISWIINLIVAESLIKFRPALLKL